MGQRQVASLRRGLWLAPKWRRGAFRFSPGCCCVTATCEFCTGPADDIAITLSGVTNGDHCSACSFWNDTFILQRREDLDPGPFLFGCVWYTCFDDPCTDFKVVILMERLGSGSTYRVSLHHGVAVCDCAPQAGHPTCPNTAEWVSDDTPPSSCRFTLRTVPAPVSSSDFYCDFSGATVTIESV